MCIHLEKILLYACINYSNNTINILPCYVIDDVRRAMFITVVMRYTLTSADRDVICQVEIKSTRARSSESLISSLFYFILFFFASRVMILLSLLAFPSIPIHLIGQILNLVSLFILFRSVSFFCSFSPLGLSLSCTLLNNAVLQYLFWFEAKSAKSFPSSLNKQCVTS